MQPSPITVSKDQHFLETTLNFKKSYLNGKTVTVLAATFSAVACIVAQIAKSAFIHYQIFNQAFLVGAALLGGVAFFASRIHVNTKFNTSIKNLIEEKKRLLEEIATIKVEKQSTESDLQKLHDIQLKAEKTENSTLSEKLLQKQSEIDFQNLEIERITKEKQFLEDNLKQVQADLKTAQGTVHYIYKLEEETVESSGDKEKLPLENYELKLVVESLKNEKQVLEEQLIEKQSKIDFHHSEIKKLQEEFSYQQQETQKAITTSLEKCEIAERKLLELQAQNREIEARFVKAEIDLKNLARDHREKVEKLESEKGSAIDQLTSMTTLKTQSELEGTHLKQKLKELQKSIISLEANLQKLEKQQASIKMQAASEAVGIFSQKIEQENTSLAEEPKIVELQVEVDMQEEIRKLLDGLEPDEIAFMINDWDIDKLELANRVINKMNGSTKKVTKNLDHSTSKVNDMITGDLLKSVKLKKVEPMERKKELQDELMNKIIKFGQDMDPDSHPKSANDDSDW